jgi:hypothetical protein
MLFSHVEILEWTFNSIVLDYREEDIVSQCCAVPFEYCLLLGDLSKGKFGDILIQTKAARAPLNTSRHAIR